MKYLDKSLKISVVDFWFNANKKKIYPVNFFIQTYLRLNFPLNLFFAIIVIGCKRRNRLSFIL